MGQSLSYSHTGSKVRIHATTNTLAAPTAGPAEAIKFAGAGWKSGSNGSRGVLLKVWGDDASVDVAGPVEVTAYHAGDSRWYYVGALDKGANINVGNGVAAPARIWRLTDIPGWATAIQLKSGAITGGNISAEVEPLEISGAS